MLFRAISATGQLFISYGWFFLFFGRIIRMDRDILKEENGLVIAAM